MYDELFETFKTFEKSKINCFLGLELSPPRSVILMLCKINLNEHNSPVRPSQISEKLEVKPAAITPILNKLESDGYIKREVSPQDRREVLVTLTLSGMRMCAEIEKHMKQYYDRMTASVGQDAIDQLNQLAVKFDQFNQQEDLRRSQHKEAPQ